MEREKLPMKTIVITGGINGLLFALFMAGFDYFNGDSFSILKFLFHFMFFGFFMAISFRYKYTKKKD